MRRVNIKNLVLRKKIYYFRISFKKSDGTFSSIKKSLGTSDLNLAIQRLEIYKKELLMKINNVELDTSKKINIHDYLNQIGKTQKEQAKVIEQEYSDLSDDEVVSKYFKCEEIMRISKTGTSATLVERCNAYNAAELERNKLHILIHYVRAVNNQYIKNLFDKCMDLFRPQQITWEQFVYGVNSQTQPMQNKQIAAYNIPASMPKNTIREILTKSLEKNAKSIQRRFPQALEKMLKPVNISLDDDYSKMNDESVIKKIVEHIKNKTDANNDSKNKILNVLRKVIKQAHKKEPDFYMGDKLLYHVSDLLKTPDGEKQEYGVFNDEQLAKMFDPKHDFFKKHPDEFLACLIALYSGSRTNLGITLQYGDFIQKDSIDCFWFRENNDKKNKKNKASERKLPIAQQLLDWGIIDIIRARQKKTGAADTDFIFDRAANLSGDPAKKFMTPWLNFIRTTLGIVSKDGLKYTFHSFRDTLSMYTKTLGIDDSVVDDIIGWEGSSMRNKHYMKYTTAAIKAEVDKIVYPEEILHLEEWKKIIPDLYLNPEHISNKRGNYKPHIKID